MYCPNCGAQAPPNAKFCMACGIPFPQPPEPRAAEPSAPRPSAVAGPAPSSSQASPRTTVPQPCATPDRPLAKKSGRGPGLFLGLGALVLLLAAGIFALPQFLKSHPGAGAVAATPTVARPAVAVAPPTPTPALPDFGKSARVLSTSFDPGQPAVLPEGPLAGGKAVVEDGAYCLTAGQPRPTVGGTSFAATGLVLEAAATYSAGARTKTMGLVLRAGDANGAGGVYFELGDDESWSVLRQAADGSLKSVAGPKRLADAATGKKVTRRLGVIVKDRSATFYVDGDEVHRLSDAPTGGDFLGLYAASLAPGREATGCFDDLHAEDLPEKAGDDRQRVLAAFGRPQAFGLAFVPGAGTATVRNEVWYYFSHLSAFTFEDGQWSSAKPWRRRLMSWSPPDGTIPRPSTPE